MSIENISESAKEMLARVDERTHTILNDFKEMRIDLKNHITVFDKSLEDHVNKLENFKKEIENSYVKKETFSPIQKLVYSFVGLVLVAFASVLISQIIPEKIHEKISITGK